jgi:hypothetical protein
MNINEEITRYTNLETNDSLSGWRGNLSQQYHGAYEVFYEFIKEHKPSRILEIGTALGGFTNFLNTVCKELSLQTKILTYDIIEKPNYTELREGGIDVRIENVFDFESSLVNQEVIDFIRGEGVTFVLCDGGWKKGEFNILSNYVKEGDFILAHDYSEDENIFRDKIYKKIWNWHEIQLSDISESCTKNGLEYYKKETFENVAWSCRIKPYVFFKGEISETKSTSNGGLTLVTGIWDIGRDNLSEGWSRTYQHYIDKFTSLLETPANMIIFGDESLRDLVFSKRNHSNTQFISRGLDWFKQNDFFDKIQKIRTNPEWKNQVGWLSESTQSRLENYNPLVMSKMFLLHDAKILDKFESEFLFWIDGGLTNTVHPGYFTHDKVLEKLPKYISKFSFVCFPYEANTEIHGFEAKKLYSTAGSKVNKVARGGFFGGPKDTISDINGIYYNLLQSTLSDGFMGTEESIFSIMCFKHDDIINYFEIDGNGLMGKFFEDLKNDSLKVMSNSVSVKENSLDINKVGLYVIAFNSPNQFSTLIKSFDLYDKEFLIKPKKYLLNNSTDESTFDEYDRLCKEFGFEHIKKDNLGICGGRQFIAEHFEKSEQDFMFFFEDDMFFYNGKDSVCKNGFNRYVNGLYSKSIQICKRENFDFLKLNYTEFFGDNGTQWSWYNVPQNIREKYWPFKNRLPEIGLDPNAPKTEYKNILSYQGVPYSNGDVYYCNWPQVVTKEGNRKMFLETKWAHPFEQTWMSYMFQLTKLGDLKPGLLLISPTEHNRFEHYDGKLRKES